VERTADTYPLEERWASQAEEVRAYLVQIRGGAPFLSGADGRVLLTLLEEGVPVPAILAAIERMAERRRGKRVRRRLTLNACKKLLGAPEPPPLTPPEESPDGLLLLAEEIARPTVSEELAPIRAQLCAELGRLGRADLPAESRAVAAIAACRAFHTAVWEADTTDRPALYAAATAELEPLRAGVSPRLFTDLLEEAARDRLRREFPLVSANEVWDRLRTSSSAQNSP